MEKLLQEINRLIQEEKIIKEEKEQRGENFNVFEIMHAQSDEVNTHSAVLAALLNPKGNHGCKSAFLTSFVEKFISQKGETSSVIFDTDIETCHIYVEYSIGEVAKDYATGGRLDIVVESEKKDKAIIIENKIYASDQPKQLYRYMNYADAKYGKDNYIIMYLTLDGHKPSKESIGEMKEGVDFYIISYKSFILEWLDVCKEKATSNPIVRETITQYYNLISKLTNQNMESSTKEKLIDTLANRENISAVFKVHSVYDDVLNKVCNTLLLDQIKEVASELDMHCTCSEKNWCKRWNGQFFFSLPEWRFFCIGFEFMGDDLTDFNYGIRYKSEVDKEKSQDIRKMIEEKLGGKTNSWWASYKPFKYSNWNNEVVFEQLYDGAIKSEIMKNVADLLSMVEGFEL